MAKGGAAILPHLNLYVPPRALLLGQVPGAPVWPFVLSALGDAALYATVFISLGVVFFQRREFP